jgi:predicted  nucleic acid-binding Zn-ribbon protein
MTEVLLDLQDLDTAIDRHRHRRATLPERAALADLDASLAQRAAVLAKAIVGRDEVAGRQAELEAELASTEARIAAVNRRLYGGEVSASRELAAMQADVEGLRQRASDLEDRILALLEEREPFDGEVDAAEEAIAALETRLAEALRALAAAEAVVDGELAGLEAQRQEAAAGIDPEALSAYEQLRARMGGVAVARLVGSRCDGCHLTLPATELDRIRHLPPGELATCDQCGRILVRS